MGKPQIPNLYERRGYYSWRHPETREEFGLGKNRQAAIQEAIEANLKFAKPKIRLIDRIEGIHQRTILGWAEKYWKQVERKTANKNTRKSYKSLQGRLVEMLGADTPIKHVTALEFSEKLEALSLEKARTAQALLHYSRDFFRAACVQGWIDQNPVRDTKLLAAPVVKRARLEYEVFLALCDAEKLPWARNAYALGLTSAQRREDIVNAKFADFHDGGWWCDQASEKSQHGHRIFLPLELQPVGFLSLGDVLSQCRKSGVLSHYLVHQTSPRGNSPVGSQIWLDTLSRRFSATLKLLGPTFGDKSPPTFHEIRSLSERLYRAQGVDTKTLLGHTEQSMTDVYNDSRGGWVRVTV